MCTQFQLHLWNFSSNRLSGAKEPIIDNQRIMHGRAKRSTPLSDAEQKAVNDKAATYNKLLHILIEKRDRNEHTDESLLLTEKMVKTNPDFFTFWNFRRNILITLYGPTFGLSNEDQKNKILEASLRDKELALSAEGIQRNAKSYGAWHHRQWIAKRFAMDYQSELSLCRMFLKEDQRNFHCWNYRRFIVAEGGINPEEEFGFSSEKIAENFSNYSAFHHRSVYLKDIIINSSGSSSSGSSSSGKVELSFSRMKEIVESDIQMIENAIFTEPDDQSAWWYIQFLLEWCKECIFVSGCGDGEGKQWLRVLCWSLLDMMQSLLELEEGCKWAASCVVNLADVLIEIDDSRSISSHGEHLSVIRQRMLQQLIKLDPWHTKRYQYLLGRATAAAECSDALASRALSAEGKEDKQDWVNELEITNVLLIRHAESYNNTLYDVIRERFGEDVSCEIVEEQEAELRQADPSLSHKGFAQASMLGAYAGDGSYFARLLGCGRTAWQESAVILSSPMYRCLLTTHAISDNMPGVPVVVLPHLYESFGLYKKDPVTRSEVVLGGRSSSDVRAEFPGYTCVDMDNGWYHSDHKETHGEFYERAAKISDWLWTQHGLKKSERLVGDVTGFDTIILVIHGNLISALLSKLLSGNACLVPSDNTGVTHVQMVTAKRPSSDFSAAAFTNSNSTDTRETRFAVLKTVSSTEHLERPFVGGSDVVADHWIQEFVQ